MKRQSKAEEALKKQIRILQTKKYELDTRLSTIKTKHESYKIIQMQLEAEISNLRQAREASSIRNKPKA